MSTIVQYSDWLEEECDNMAIEGLRTMIVARKFLSPEQYNNFEVSVNGLLQILRGILDVANRSNFLKRKNIALLI